MNPAPLVPGISFASATNAQVQPPPPAVQVPQPTSNNTPSTSAPQPTELAQLFALMLSLKEEVTATRTELTEVKIRLNKFEAAATRLDERNAVQSDNGDSDSDSDVNMDDTYIHTALPDQQQNNA